MDEKDERLQRYFDGEMTADERARFEAEMTPDDRVRLEALGEMSALLRTSLAEEAQSVDIWSGIAAEVQRAPAKVVDISHARTKRRGLTTRFLGAATALAAAAAFVLFLKPGPMPTNECDVEVLDAEGQAAVFKIPDPTHGEEATTTVIWTQED